MIGRPELLGVLCLLALPGASAGRALRGGGARGGGRLRSGLRRVDVGGGGSSGSEEDRRLGFRYAPYSSGGWNGAAHVAAPIPAPAATDGARGHYDENGNWVGYPMTGPVPVPVPVPVPAAPVAAPIPAPAATDGARGYYDENGRWVGYPMTGPVPVPVPVPVPAAPVAAPIPAPAATDGARGHYDENGNWVGYPMTGPVPVPVPAAPVAAPIPAPAATDGARGHYDSSGRWVGYPMTGPSYPNPNWWGAYGAGPPTDRPTRIPTLAPTASDTGRPTRPPSPTIPPTPRPPEVAQGGLSLRGGPIDGGEGAFLGSSVSMSADGTIVATSSPGSFNQTGTVRVLRYEARSGEWTQLGQDIVGSAEGDYLGDSARAVVLSRSGDYLAVASPSNSDDRGFVWIFAYNPLADRWTRVGRDIEGSVAGEASGHALALSSNGMVVAVGAPYAESMGMFLSGSVRIYSLQATPEAVGLDWVLAGQVGGANGRDEAGYSLALSADGSRIAIGAPEAGSSAGELRVLQLTDPVPTALPANATQAEIAQAQLQTATQIGDNIFGTQFEDYLGISVSMSADGLRLAVGADMFGTSRNGEVRVLEWNAVDGTWDQMGQTLIGDEANDSFGWLVALNAAGNVLAASAINDEDSEYTKVYRYDLNTSRWVLLVKYEGASRGEAGYAQSGYSIDVNDAGTLLTVGAPESSVNGDRSGQVRVFELS